MISDVQPPNPLDQFREVCALIVDLKTTRPGSLLSVTVLALDDLRGAFASGDEEATREALDRLGAIVEKGAAGEERLGVLLKELASEGSPKK